ncbi:unnamed protein product [Spirodela intermedia]|uniref:Dirigent protein n=1 Tax=Spirodela intermedia TaxID=51605 RepID=A0A7I8IJQ6_SPIIN|nr:unnamed protein product [Spirodela intermedia]CAA6657731.1 unnamed protein product [Spirodela intermedia]
MLPRIIFCTAVSAATLPKLQRSSPRPKIALSLYVQPPPPPGRRPSAGAQPAGAALVFHHTLTEGPGNLSRVVGKAQGFIIPAEHFAHSAFNLVYLTFRTPEYSGSVGVEGRRLRQADREELGVLGGTGSFAFARGRAVLTRTGRPGAAPPPCTT